MTLSPQLKAALREILCQVGTETAQHIARMADGESLPNAGNEILDRQMVALEAALQPEIERLVVEARLKQAKIFRKSYPKKGARHSSVSRMSLAELDGCITELTQELTQLNKKEGNE